jgi:hypothetical protein
MKIHPQGSSSPLVTWWAAVIATAGGAVKKPDHGAEEEETMTIASNASFDDSHPQNGSDPAANHGREEKKKGKLAERFQGIQTSMRSVCTMLVTKLSINNSKSKTTKANTTPTTSIKKRRQDIAEFYV